MTHRPGDGREIGGTALTIIKHSRSPLARLVDAGRIGAEELRAADEISRVFAAISGAMMVRAASVERIDRGGGHGEPAWMADAQARYRAWASYWSARAKRGDPSLKITIAAVIDERPLRSIDHDLRIRNGRAGLVVAAMLRDYAARAWWTDAKTASAWVDAATSRFRLRQGLTPGTKSASDRST